MKERKIDRDLVNFGKLLLLTLKTCRREILSKKKKKEKERD